MRSGNISVGNGRGFEKERMIFRGGTCVEWAQVKDSSAVEGEGEEKWVGDAEMESEGKLSVMCWNVCVWCKVGSGMEQMREMHDMRAEVLHFYKPDVVTLVETWLKGEEEIGVEGYWWFGRSRRSLHRKAVRGVGWSWSACVRGGPKEVCSGSS